MTGSTILITGGGSGIGRGLAERFQQLGNTIIIAGRRRDILEKVTAANPGMYSAVLDVRDAGSIQRFAQSIVSRHPSLNVLINNAGIMQPENMTTDVMDPSAAEIMVATNLLGPIRLITALLPHFRSRPASTILNVSSGLAFVPLAATPTYSATKAAIHSFSLSLRQQLENTSTEVIEIIPPYVQTQLMGEMQVSDPKAMPLDAFLAETLELLQRQPTPPEIIVERAGFLRRAESENRFETTFLAVNAH